ncbi:MAG: hypothetical protein MJ168_11965 [Clostridia bacterium]|nr:hypothetical protein [Clostridia bacterium]
MFESSYEEEITRKPHYVKACISILLVVALAFIPLFKVYAETQTQTEYVSEIKYCQKNTEAEAKSWLTSNGYRVVDKNLNEGGRGGVVFMGYKTTGNKYDAITDIAYMEENGGYELMDYRDYIASNATTFSDISDEMVAAGKEIRRNYEYGNKTAKAALKALNYVVMEKDDTQTQLTGFGDWLTDSDISDNTKKAEITNILALCNSNLINFIYGQIAVGTTCDTNYSWVKELSLIGKGMQPEYASDRDGFIQSARQLIPALQGFAQSYNAMERRRAENDGEIKLSKDLTDLKDAKESEISKIEHEGLGNQQKGLTVEEGEKQVKTPTEESLKNSDLIAADVNDGDLISYTLYEKLKEIPFEDETVADYLIDLGERKVDLTDPDKAYAYYRDIFPLIYVLSPGQFAAIHMDGLNNAIAMDLEHSNESVSEAIAKIDETGKELIEANDGHRLSIWYDVDKSLYESKVGVTSQQRRKNAAAGLKTLRDRTTQKYDTLNTTLKALDAASAATAVVAIGISVGVKIAKYLAAKSLASAIAAGTIAAGATTGVSTGVAVASIVSTVFNIVSVVIVVATIVISIVLAILKSRDEAAYENPDHEQIPLLMYDIIGQYTVKYEVCKNQDGNPADLNAGNCKYWSAPYYTKSATAGDPITVPTDNSEVFKVQVTDTSTPNGYKPLHFFEESIVGNTNRGTHNETTNSEIFVFAHTGTAYQATETSTGDVEYISDLRIFTGNNYTVEAAKADAYNSDFTLIEINLTPEDGTTANYLGYKTSKSLKEAVKDIRVGPASLAKQYTHGEVSYGNAGAISNCAGLFFSSDENVGTPIRKENLRIFKSHNNIPEGFEPVNAFSGGDAFNLASSARNDGKYEFLNNDACSKPYNTVHEWTEENSRYLYFKPETTYTSSNSVKYISGFVYLTASDKMMSYVGSTDFSSLNNAAVDSRLNRLAKELNVTIIDESKYVEAVGEHYYSTIDYLRSASTYEVNPIFAKTVLAYSTTYNPYRAAYDVKFYKMGDKANGCLTSVSSNGAVYSACEHEYNMAEVHEEPVSYGTYVTDKLTRYYSKEHGLISRPYRVFTDYEKSTFEDHNIQKLADRSLYVSGYVSNGKPIKETDIKFSNSSTVPDGMISVRNIGEYTGDKPVNIASEYSQNDLYMFLKGKPNEKGKFIEKIYVGYSDTNENGLGLDYAKTSAGAGKGVDVLPFNLCNKNGGRDEENGDHAAYIGVSRTDDMEAAVSGIVLIPSAYCTTVSSSNKRTPLTTKNINGTEYHLAEGMFESGSIKGDGYTEDWALSGYDYYIYYCKGSSEGSPVSDIVVDQSPYIAGCTTVADAINGLDMSRGAFMHTLQLIDGKMPAYISKIAVFEGISLADAVHNAIAAGYPYVITNNLNPGQQFGWEEPMDSFYVSNLLSDYQRESLNMNSTKYDDAKGFGYYKYKVLAYRRTAYESKAIRNIVATYGEPKTNGDDFEYYQIETLNLFKRTISAKMPVKYNLADHVFYNTDLNSHRYAGQVYLYYTTHDEGYRSFDKVNGKNVGVFDYKGPERAPITNIAVHNVGSAYSGNKDVHYVCNVRTGEKQDINQGRSILIDSDYVAHDSRCYIIFSRSNDAKQIDQSNLHPYIDDGDPEISGDGVIGGAGAVYFGEDGVSENDGRNGKDELFDIDYSKLRLVKVYGDGSWDDDEEGYDGEGGDF